MEDNKDKRSEASYDQDEALKFLREPARSSPVMSAGKAQSTLNAQNNKGATPTRLPINQTRMPSHANSSSVQNSTAKPIQGQQTTGKRPLHNLSQISTAAKPQPSPVQQKPMQPQNSNANAQRITPLQNRKSTPSAADEARKTGASAFVPAPQNHVQNHANAGASRERDTIAPKITPIKNPANSPRPVQNRGQVKPISAQNGLTPMPANSLRQQTPKRTENDDFEIDEITYTRNTRRVRHDEGVADSATSAVMSLVKALVYIVAIIAVSVGLAVFIIGVGNDVFKFTSDEKIVTVTIPEYATIDDITDALYDAGAIKYKWAFKMWSNLKTKGKTLEFAAGTYDLSTSLNYDYLRMAFRKNTGAHVEVRITIPEGYTVDEIIDLFVSKGIGTREGFVDAIQNYAFDYPFLNGLTVSPDRIYRLEGYLFPDTYNFYQDSSEVVVLKKLLDNFNNKFVEAYYARCDQLGITVDEAIILASMVEKETRYADELGYVSSVFHNRLKYSATFPYLNSDATIMYAMQHDLGGRPDSMTGEDTEYKTPYNTYQNKGFPPGPIANPGLNSIKYALYPNDTKYFYFVSDSNGRMLFAQTEPEHLANINKVRGN